MLTWSLIAILAVWLGFPNNIWSLPPAVLFWPIGIAVLGVNARGWHAAFLTGWLVSAAAMLTALYWLYLPVAEVGGLPLPMALLCAIFIALCLAVQGGIFSLLAFGLKHYNPWLFSLVLALCWYLLEYGFAVAVGVPWLPLAGALVQWPLLVQVADSLGAYLAGALWLLAAFLCLPPSGLTFARNQRPLMAATGVTLVSALLWYGIYGFALASLQTSVSADALMVEGNVNQNQKWTPPFQQKSLAIYLRLTSRGLARARAAGMERPLILWPETAMPFFYERSPALAERLRQAVRDWNCPLLFGAPGVGRKGGEDAIYNRAFLLDPAGQTQGEYDKVHLVPFGEYLPSWLKLDFLEALLQGVGIYEEGSSIKSLNYEELALGVLICYEGIFPWLARDRVSGGANILVDISNDGWFGRTPAASQHLYLTALRCIEENRWLWRATNTGISALVDNRGRLVLTGPMFREGFLLCRARLITERSLFYYLCHWLPWLASGLVCFFLAAGRAGYSKSGS